MDLLNPKMELDLERGFLENLFPKSVLPPHYIGKDAKVHPLITEGSATSMVRLILPFCFDGVNIWLALWCGIPSSSRDNREDERRGAIRHHRRNCSNRNIYSLVQKTGKAEEWGVTVIGADLQHPFGLSSPEEMIDAETYNQLQ